MPGLAGALSFLSCLPCGKLRIRCLKEALPFFGMAGLFISLFALLPALALSCMPSLAVPPLLLSMLAAAIWLLAEICLTRGIHWDGLADLADAMAARPEMFRKILADPHIGAFGALIATLLLLLQLLGAAGHFLAFIEAGKSSLAAFAPVGSLALSGMWSRLCPLWLGRNSSAARESTLGALFCGKVGFHCFLVNLAQAAACLCALWLLGASMLNLCLLASGQLFLVRCMRAKAEKHGGISGDFMGAGIVLSQTLFILFSLP